MKRHILYLFLCGIAFFATSCVSQKDITTYSYQPSKVLRIEMSDLTYLGDVNVEVVYKKYGIVTKIYTVNGKAYDPRFFTETKIATSSSSYSSYLSKALYKVQETYPEAEYIIPISKKEQVEYMNGGRIIKETMTVKAYKLK